MIVLWWTFNRAAEPRSFGKLWYISACTKFMSHCLWSRICLLGLLFTHSGCSENKIPLKKKLSLPLTQFILATDNTAITSLVLNHPPCLPLRHYKDPSKGLCVIYISCSDKQIHARSHPGLHVLHSCWMKRFKQNRVAIHTVWTAVKKRTGCM